MTNIVITWYFPKVVATKNNQRIQGPFTHTTASAYEATYREWERRIINLSNRLVSLKFRSLN